MKKLSLYQSQSVIITTNTKNNILKHFGLKQSSSEIKVTKDVTNNNNITLVQSLITINNININININKNNN